MIFAIYPIVALLGATVHNLRHREADRAKKLETYLLWWIVVTIGVAGIVGGLFHILDGKQIAEEIGFTRGDGGFQFENAMGDIAIGTIAILCIWFRGNFWLAVLIAAAISLWGDAYGHIYQSIEYDNHDPDNTGLVLYADIVFPLVGLILFALYRRAGGGRPAAGPAASPA